MTWTSNRATIYFSIYRDCSLYVPHPVPLSIGFFLCQVLNGKLLKAKDKNTKRDIRKELRSLAREERKRQQLAVTDVIKNADIVLTTLTGSFSHKLESSAFDLVIIDEAAQALEVACWIALLKVCYLFLFICINSSMFSGVIYQTLVSFRCLYYYLTDIIRSLSFFIWDIPLCIPMSFCVYCFSWLLKNSTLQANRTDNVMRLFYFIFLLIYMTLIID